MTLAPERVLVMPQNAVASGHITCSNVHAMGLHQMAMRPGSSGKRILT